MNKQSMNVRNGMVWWKQFWGETLLFFQKKLNTVWSEYVKIVYDSEILIGIYEVYAVWDESDIEIFSKLCGKYFSGLLSDDDRYLSVSQEF